MELKIVRNLTAVDQSVVYKGTQITLRPKEEKPFVKEVADFFLAEAPLYVQEIEAENFGQPYEAPNDIADIWVANMSGDPDAPETVKVKKWHERQWSLVDVPNPKKDPITVGRDLDLGMTAYTDASDHPAALNLGKKRIAVPPYNRRKLPLAIGEWFLERDGSQFPTMRGVCIKSRAPSTFEPNMQWNLDDMRLYLKLTDASAVEGPSEAACVRSATKGNVEPELVLFEAKALCMKRLHKRLVDPQYRLPNKKEFDSFKGSQVAGAPKVATVKSKVAAAIAEANLEA